MVRNCAPSGCTGCAIACPGIGELTLEALRVGYFALVRRAPHRYAEDLGACGAPPRFRVTPPCWGSHPCSYGFRAAGFRVFRDLGTLGVIWELWE